jgi:small subunit ribosomal protein S1
MSLLPVLYPGDLVEGKILSKSSVRIFVDLGKYGTGVIYRGEMQNAKSYVKGLKVGDILYGKVISVDNEEGLIELSITEADKQKVWNEILEMKEKEEALKVKITGFNKGGLMTDIKGLTAFLPVSQLSSEHYPKFSANEKNKILQALQLFVGQEFLVKIIDANPRTNKLIISEKAAYELSAKDLVKNYTPGQIVECVVSGVADFGAFLRFTDNPQIEGFVHISEIDWKIIENPKEILKIDDVVKAKIIEIKDGKVYLSLKALKEDPWIKAEEYFKEKDEVKGAVYLYNQFGAIINLPYNLQGLVKITHFGDLQEMKKKLPQGAVKEFIIESIKPQERRIMLLPKE